ncbi:hypothetical protein O3P69_019952 [Scylla paramamosain]|uniref:Peptidase A2 domain-containing protein n=1 Tax=Scylla paramamosain TaxID=85552 RepID=A0AAW0SIH4_SCYPA
MPKGGKKPTPPPAPSEGGSPQSSPPPSPSVPMDVQALLQWMADREEAARAEREEQRREDAARFEALLTRLAPMSLQPSVIAASNSTAPKGCPATEAVCHGCGKTGHWSHMEKCPAKTVQCNACSRYGHFEKLCKSSNPKSQHSSKPKLQKTKKNSRATIHVVRTQSPLSRVPETSKQEASNVRRVHSTVRVKPTPSPTICIVVTHGERSNTMEMIPDTGADTTVIGPQHLQHLGLTSRNLQPPPSLDYYNADDLRCLLLWVPSRRSSPMASCRARGGSMCKHCRELGIIPKDFPRQITDDVSTVGRIRESTSATPVATVQCHRQPASVVAPLPAPSPSLPLHANTSLAEAKEYFLQEYADVLVKKDDLQKAPLQPMSGSPMRIHLREDAKPFAVHTPRLIPRAYQDHVKAELDSMVAQVSNPTIDDDALDAETSFSVRSIVTLGSSRGPLPPRLLTATQRWRNFGVRPMKILPTSSSFSTSSRDSQATATPYQILCAHIGNYDLPPTDATPPGAESPQPALPRRSARIKGQERRSRHWVL